MATRQSLPLDGSWIAAEDGWLITLPARFERVEVSRQVVETEEVVVRVARREEVQRFEEQTRREELRVHADGDAEVAPAVATDPVLHK